MKKFKAFVMSSILAAVLLLCCSCGVFDLPDPDANYPSDVAVARGEAGSPESFLAADATPSTELRRAYEEAAADGFEGSYYEFLEGLGLSDDSARIQSALPASVSVFAFFTRSNGAKYYSAGSGVIYDLDADMGTAILVTNYHVIYNVGSRGDETVTHISDDIRIYLYGELTTSRTMTATYVGGAMEYDIAVLSVTNDILKEGFAREIVGADSDSLSVGERVYAIGNADGKGMSVTQGVVSVPAENISVKSADEKKSLTMLEIRTDADLNHGNSGGGLFNGLGELVGIVNARTEDDEVEGFGYALPANRVLALVQNILDTCAADPEARGAAVAYLGVTSEVAGKKSVFDERTGKVYTEEKVTLKSIEYNSPANLAGLREADTMLSGRLFDASGALVREVNFTSQHRIGDLMFFVRLSDRLEFTVSRTGEEEPVTVTIEYNDKEMFRAKN